MTQPRQLARPPITEALVDLRIASDKKIDADLLRPLQNALAAAYPKHDEKRQFQAELRVEAGKILPPTARDLGFQGLWLTSGDDTRVVQFRPDGFTFNNLGSGGYMGGEALIDEALSLWFRFVETVGSVTVLRVALRYLNSLDLPWQRGDDLKRFLTAPPETPPGSPQRVSGFLSRVVAIDESGATAVITQTMAESTPSVVLDIDVFFAREFSPSVEVLRQALEILRNLKNRVFFSLLTEEAVKLYV